MVSPIHHLGPANMTAMSFLDAAWFRDQRGIVLAGMLDALRMGRGTGLRRRAMLGALLAALVVSTLCSLLIQMWMAYRGGALSFYSYLSQGNPIWGGVWGGASTEFNNNYSWSYRAAYNPQTVNNRRTRGGPLTLNRPGYELTTSFDTDSKKKLFYFVSFDDYTTEPVKSSFGYHVIKVLERDPHHTLSDSEISSIKSKKYQDWFTAAKQS